MSIIKVDYGNVGGGINPITLRAQTSGDGVLYFWFPPMLEAGFTKFEILSNTTGSVRIQVGGNVSYPSKGVEYTITANHEYIGNYNGSANMYIKFS